MCDIGRSGPAAVGGDARFRMPSCQGASGRPVRGTGGTQVAERSQDGKGRKIEEEIFFANKSTSDGLEGSPSTQRDWMTNRPSGERRASCHVMSN